MEKKTKIDTLIEKAKTLAVQPANWVMQNIETPIAYEWIGAPIRPGELIHLQSYSKNKRYKDLFFCAMRNAHCKTSLLSGFFNNIELVKFLEEEMNPETNLLEHTNIRFPFLQPRSSHELIEILEDPFTDQFEVILIDRINFLFDINAPKHYSIYKCLVKFATDNNKILIITSAEPAYIGS